MIEMYAIAVVALLAAGAMIGVLIVFAFGIWREDKNYSLSDTRPGPLASGVRAVTNAYAHPWVGEHASHRPPGLALAGRSPAVARRR